jgi:hypothetical protein
MPAPKRIRDDEIMTAIRRWRGNVTAAADALGIARVNLKKRLDALGIDPSAIRTGAMPADTHRYVSIPNDPNETNRTQRNASAGTFLEQKTPDIFSGRSRAAKFSSVQQAVDKDARAASVPIRTINPKRKPLRLEPENEDKLVEFQRRVEALYGVDTELQELHNQFFEEAFPEWAARKLAAAQPAVQSAEEPRPKAGKDHK